MTTYSTETYRVHITSKASGVVVFDGTVSAGSEREAIDVAGAGRYDWRSYKAWARKVPA